MALPLFARLEAILFASGEPLSLTRLGQILDATHEEVGEAIVTLHQGLTGRGLALVVTDTEVELRTAPDAAESVKKLRESELARDLGKASLETLAMVLYKGGATRSEIDWVRGVNSGAALRSLLMRGLVERIDDPADKRRAKYLPTAEALAHLGVSARDHLPRFEEFSAALLEQEAKAAQAAESLT